MSSTNDTRISRRTPARTQNEIQRDKDKAKVKKIVIRAVLICALVLALFLIFINTGLFYRTATAATVDGRNFSVAEFNIYYMTSVNNNYSALHSNYGDFANQVLDTSKPYDQQMYSSTMTWDEFFTQTSLAKMTSVKLLNDMAAKDDGFSLTEDQKAELDSLIASPETYAKLYNISVSRYLQSAYGKGVNRKLYNKTVTEMYIADVYGAYIADNYEYTSDQLDSYYKAHTNDFDTVSFRAYQFLAETGDEVDKDKALEDTKAVAQEIVDSADSADKFDELILDYEKENDLRDGVIVSSYIKYAGVSETYREWLFSNDRQPGDTTVIVNSSKNGCYALYFEGRDTRDYPYVEVRQILVSADTDDSGNTIDSSMPEAKAKAEALLAEWKSGAATEESFKQLLDDHSSEDDVNGSYIDRLYYGATGVTVFEEWALDPERQPGDTEIIETPYGYHIAYFVRTGDNAREYYVRKTMADENYTDWLEQQLNQTSATLNKFGYYFTRDF